MLDKQTYLCYVKSQIKLKPEIELGKTKKQFSNKI